MSPTCRAYITAASRALSNVLGGARRGPVVHDDAKSDHQLRLTTVAQQVSHPLLGAYCVHLYSIVLIPKTTS